MLTAYCYWNQRKRGLDAQAATANVCGLSIGQQHEMLFEQGINFNDLANWQKRGIGIYWEEYERTSRLPATGEEGTVLCRRRMKRNFELPMKEAYSEFILRLTSG